jgi:hypothetical protein
VLKDLKTREAKWHHTYVRSFVRATFGVDLSEATMFVLTGLAIGLVVLEVGTILMSTALCVERHHKPKDGHPHHGGVAMGGPASSVADMQVVISGTAIATALANQPPPPLVVVVVVEDVVVVVLVVALVEDVEEAGRMKINVHACATLIHQSHFNTDLQAQLSQLYSFFKQSL